MSDTGMFRRIDDLGRIVLPAELRKTLGLIEGTMLDIFLEDNRIVLTPRLDACVFCRSRQDLKEFRGKMVCAGCISDFTGSGAASQTAPESSWEPFAES